MPRNIHPITGCRPDQLFGEWAIDPDVHQRLVDLCIDLPLVEVVKMGEAEANEPPPKLYEANGRVAVIRLSGPLTKQPTSFDSVVGGGSTVRARQALRAAASDSSIDRILMVLESPGGTAAGTKDLFDHIHRTDKQKPVYTHANDMCGSAAFWIACGGRRFTANANAMVGSIGAYTVLRDTTGRQEQSGIKLHVVSSGKFKGAGAEGTAVNDDALKEVQNRINALADLFVSDVASARKMKPEDVKQLADGRSFIASKAKELGLIDAVANEEDVISELNHKSPQVRSTNMYTNEQLAQVRQLPGAAQATEENADILALSSALEMQRQLSSTRQELASARASLPPNYPDDLVQAYADLALNEATLKLSEGKMLPPQFDAFKKLIFGTDNKPKASMVCAAPGQRAPYKDMLAVLDLNKPNGLVTEKTSGQPAPKTEPGEQTSATQGKDIPSYERWNQIREKGKLPLMSMEEYKAFFNL